MSLGEIFDVCGFGVIGDQRAMSEAELAQWAASYAHLTAQAKPSLDWYQSLANYRPPVHVPQGYADWFAIGDGLP